MSLLIDKNNFLKDCFRFDKVTIFYKVNSNVKYIKILHEKIYDVEKYFTNKHEYNYFQNIHIDRSIMVQHQQQFPEKKLEY